MFKKLTAAALALSFVFISGCGGREEGKSETQGEPIAVTQKYQDGRDFSSITAKQLEKSGENLVFSPVSAYTAIAMAAEGADGETLGELEKLLGGSIEDIRSKVIEAKDRLNREDDENNKVLMAQSVWTQNGTEFSEDYMHRLASDYNADMFSGELSDKSIMNGLNAWAKDKTNGLIDPFMNKPFSEDTVLALVNALYFKGSWGKPFGEETHKDVFTDLDGKESQAEYMEVKDFFRYIDTEDALGVVLPYSFGHCSFTAIMPKRAGETPSDLLYRLGTDGIRELADSAEGKLTLVTMPKFETESSLDLGACFRDRGIKLPFGADADFSKTGAEGIYISDIIQKAKISVDEKGTEAAAVTAVMLDEMAIVGDTAMLADFSRPFLYMITDSETETPLFIGLYNYNK